MGRDNTIRPSDNQPHHMKPSSSAAPILITTIEEEDQQERADIVFVKDSHGNNKIKAATFEALARRLVDGSPNDFHYLTALLLTYRLYITPVALLEMLADFYYNPCLALKTETKTVNSPVRIR